MPANLRYSIPERLALNGRDQRMCVKVDAAGREVTTLLSENKAVTSVLSHPYRVLLEAKGKYNRDPDEPSLFEQEFFTTITTESYSGLVALEQVAFCDCRGCDKVCEDEGGCIFHTLPPHEYIRCFCLAHPVFRLATCSADGPANSECPTYCPCWRVAKVSEAESILPSKDGDSSAPGSLETKETMTFRRMGDDLRPPNDPRDRTKQSQGKKDSLRSPANKASEGSHQTIGGIMAAAERDGNAAYSI